MSREADLLRPAAARARWHDSMATRGPWCRAADHELARGGYPDNAVGYWDGEYANCVILNHGDGVQAHHDSDFTAVFRSVATPLADVFDRFAGLVEQGPEGAEWAGLSELVAVALVVLGEGFRRG